MVTMRSCLLVITCMLTACGFHLRGALNLPAAMSETHIEYAGSDIEIRQQIARQLASNGVGIASSPETATAILEIISSSVGRKVLSKNVEGRPQEYRVNVALRYQLRDAEGTLLVGSDEVTRETVLALDPNDPLGARVAVEESAKTLRADVVREMLERLSANGAASGATSESLQSKP